MLGTQQPPVALLQAGGGIIPKGTRVVVFEQIFTVFLVLGTIVGIVVISYMLHKAYKYRDGSEASKKGDGERPQLGELPQGGGGGRKLFMSFGLSAIIVISLVAWTYGTLLFVEEGAAQDPTIVGNEDPMVLEVTGYQFGWQVEYPNGHTVDSGAGDVIRVPAGRMIRLNVTSRDVMHNIGIPELRVKTDAIPGQYTNQWFMADSNDIGNTYRAACYELCGAGHSFMTADVKVMSQENFQEWYSGTSGDSESGSEDEGSDDDHGSLAAPTRTTGANA